MPCASSPLGSSELARTRAQSPSPRSKGPERKFASRISEDPATKQSPGREPGAAICYQMPADRLNRTPPILNSNAWSAAEATFFACLVLQTTGGLMVPLLTLLEAKTETKYVPGFSSSTVHCAVGGRHVTGES